MQSISLETTSAKKTISPIDWRHVFRNEDDPKQKYISSVKKSYGPIS